MTNEQYEFEIQKLFKEPVSFCPGITSSGKTCLLITKGSQIIYMGKLNTYKTAYEWLKSKY